MPGKWQPLLSDNHLRFRNWIYSHLNHNETPPLVDSVHFLARADPREPENPARECSAAKAMGYLFAYSGRCPVSHAHMGDRESTLNMHCTVHVMDDDGLRADKMGKIILKF